MRRADRHNKTGRVEGHGGEPGASLVRHQQIVSIDVRAEHDALVRCSPAAHAHSLMTGRVGEVGLEPT